MSNRIRPRIIAMTALSVILCNLAAFADVSWDSVKQKAASASNYEVIYRYDGPKGKFKFDYRINTPDHIRTEILESNDASKGAGTIIVYDAAKSKDKVTIKTGGGFLNRNLTHKDVDGTPFYQSVFSLILKQIGGGTPKASKDGDRTRFDFATGGGTFKVWADTSGDITKTERVDSHERETREFSGIKFNSNPKTSF